MTKSWTLVFGNDPENLLQRQSRPFAFNSWEDVTERVNQLALQFYDEPSPAGLRPTPDTKLKLATRRAIKTFFGAEPYWVYETPEAKPKQHICHNHVVLSDGLLLEAHAPRDDPQLDATKWSRSYFHEFFGGNTFDYWWQPAVAVLPLRAGLRPIVEGAAHGPLENYWAESECVNSARKGDIDLDRIRAARRETTNDLVKKATRLLAEHNLTPGFDWEPRYAPHWGETKEHPDYFDQAKPSLLHKHLPEHETRIDFLTLGETALDLYSDWAMLPIWSIITHDGIDMCFDLRRPSGETGRNPFARLTGADPIFLERLREAWTCHSDDTIVSIYGVHH